MPLFLKPLDSVRVGFRVYEIAKQFPPHRKGPGKKTFFFRRPNELLDMLSVRPGTF
jgi:hypothetical protein